MAGKLDNYLLNKADKNYQPLHGTLELTPMCNLNCKMCYIRLSKKQVQAQGGLLDLSQWIHWIDEMKNAGVLYISLIGGEIFTLPYLKDIYTYLVKQGFLINFTTNGTLLSEALPDWLLTSPPRYVSISLYGMSKETYKTICGNAEGYSLTIKAIENFQKNNIPVRINFCITEENFGDIEELIHYTNEHNLPLEAASYLFPPRHKSIFHPSTFQRPTAEKAAEMEYAFRKIAMSDKNFHNYCQKLSTETFKQNTPRHTTSMWCRAGRSGFWINWHGHLTACGMMETPSIDLKKYNFSEAWEQLTKQIQKLQFSPKCSTCPKREICESCPAKILAETCTFDDIPEYFCHFTDYMIQLCKHSL